MTIEHLPVWQDEAGTSLLIVGNRTVARIIPNSNPGWPQYNWLTVIEREFDTLSPSWHAVDFGDLETARHHILQWWLHRRRGRHFSCDCDPHQ
jgi:hypothetical protein